MKKIKKNPQQSSQNHQNENLFFQQEGGFFSGRSNQSNNGAKDGSDNGLKVTNTNTNIQMDPQSPFGIGPFLPPGIGSTLDAITGVAEALAGRPLRRSEIDTLTPVFGPYLNYARVRICESSLCSPDGVARTIGNLINVPPGGFLNIPSFMRLRMFGSTKTACLTATYPALY